MARLILAILIVTSLYADNNETLTPCEIATIEATKIGWSFAENNTGYKASIIADNATRRICNDKS